MSALRITSAFALLVALVAPFAQSRQIPSKDHVISILNKKEILMVAERNRIKEFADNVDDKHYSKEDLEEVALAAANKIRRDAKNLHSVTFYLQELVENEYAQKLKRIKEKDMENLREKVRDYKKIAEETYHYQELKENRPNAQQFVKIIKKESTSLTDHKRPITSHALWKKMKKIIKQPYQVWNQHFQELENSHIVDDGISETYGIQRKKKFFEIPARSSQEYIQHRTRYDVEQLEFLRDFSRLQVVLRRISSPNSDDF